MKSSLKTAICTLFLWHLYVPITAQIAVELEKMNVLYTTCAKNQLTVSVNDVPDSNLLLLPSIGEIERKRNGLYIWKIVHQDTNMAFLTIVDNRNDTIIAHRSYRVAEPVPTIRAWRGNTKDTYQPVQAIVPLFESFDYDVICHTVRFELVYIPKDKEPVFLVNLGARMKEDVQACINNASPGDQYIFSNFSYRCGCDNTTRYVSEAIRFVVR